METKKMIIDVKHSAIAQGTDSAPTPDQLSFIRVVKNNLKKSDITFEPKLGTPPSAQKANRLMQAMRQIVINNMAMPAGKQWVINGQQLMDQIINTPADSDELHLELDYTEIIDATKEVLEINVDKPGFQEFEGAMSTPDQLAFIRQVKLTLAKRGVVFDPTLDAPPTVLQANRLMAALKEIVIATMDLPENIKWVVNGMQIMDQLIATPEDADGIHLKVDYYVSEDENAGKAGLEDGWALENARHIAESAIEANK